MADTPIISRRDANISISVFYNIGTDGKGYYSGQLQRAYKKKGSDEWTCEKINLYPEDMLRIGNIVGSTYTDIKADEYKRKVAAKNSDVPF